MKRLIEMVDAFMRSDRGMRVVGTAAAVILITSVASFGANKSTDDAGPLTNDPLALDETDGSDTPVATATPVANAGVGGKVPTLSGGPLSTAPPQIDLDGYFDFGLRTQGVTDKEVKVGFSYNQAACGDAGVLEAMVGAATVGDFEKSVNAFARYINETGGIGGRKYVPQFFDDGGSGCPEKSVAAAVEMADEAKVFLAIPGLHVESDYIISRKVPVWGGRDDPESLKKYGANGLQLLEPIEPTLEAWASFGKYYLGSHNEKSPPCLVRIESGASGNWDIPQKILIEKMANYGLKFRDILVFKDDASTAQQQSSLGVAQLKDAGCKEVWFMAGNPIGLIFFTSAATQQNWFPKWTWTSYTAAVDTELAGNLMDQQQWENAVGLSVRVPPGKHPKDGNCKKIYQKYYPNDGQEGSASVLIACVTVLPTAEAMRRGVARTGELNSQSLLIGADAIRDDFYYDAHVPMSFSFPPGGPYKTRGFTHWTVADWNSDKAAYEFPKFPCYWKTFKPGLAGCEDLRSKFK
jgi:hypothetical protein